MAVMMACLRRVAVGSVVVLATAVMGQDGMDDMTDMDSMLAPPSGGDGGGGGTYKKEKELTVIQQTTLALQQLGIVIGSSSLSSLLQLFLLSWLFNSTFSPITIYICLIFFLTLFMLYSTVSLFGEKFSYICSNAM